MNDPGQTVSLVAERAVRYVRDHDAPVPSVDLAREVLAATTTDEATATRVLAAAFGRDERLRYEPDGWVVSPAVAASGTPTPEPHRTFLVLEGGRDPDGREFVLAQVAVARFEGDYAVLHVTGEPGPHDAGDDLRVSTLEALRDALPVLHAPQSAVAALERWLDAPLGTPISLRRLASDRLGLPANHTLEDLAAHLELSWRETSDRVEMVELVEACYRSLRRPDEDAWSMQRASAGGDTLIDWSRFAFDREFLRSVPRTAGTYRFFDRDGGLLYVGKSRDLHRRLGSYFRTGTRDERVRQLVSELHRIEIEPSGSDLEAVLRESAAIRAEQPEANVQRRVHPRSRRAGRLRSILILEPAVPPLSLRAYLIKDGTLAGRVGIGPRGGGLTKIERILEDRFFSVATGPSESRGPDLDVELIVRWLSANRDRVVAFDPTDLPSSREVIARLRWFLAQGGPHDPDGAPIRTI